MPPAPAPGPEDPLSICHVSPHPWGMAHEVNELIARVAGELVGRGHRVLVAAPSDSRAAVRASRRAIRAAREGERAALWSRWDGPRTGEAIGAAGGAPVLALGSGIPIPRGPRPPAAPLPLDVSRTLDELLGGIEHDLVHVHEPFAPSAASAALRHSRSLNVGSFHEPSERVLSTQVARPLVEIFLGRLDARTVSSKTTAALMERYFPGRYELVEPGAEHGIEPVWPGTGGDPGSRPVRIAYCAAEERGALRLFVRALRRLATLPGWEAAVWLPRRIELRLPARLRDRVRVVTAAEQRPEPLIAAAEIACVASGGPRIAPHLVRQALASGAVPVASDLPLHSELLADGERGLLFPPGDAITLSGQLERLVADSGLRRRLAAAGRAAVPEWGAVADSLEAIYRRVCARRHDPRGDPELRRRIGRRREIHVDLHMHTDHSPDCATSVGTLLATARDRGLGAIAITDHNEISGALAARERAAEFGVRVIVGEEVKTASQGEVIGLFLERRIEPGMSIAETIAAIRAQGGLVYVPHPFDRLHSVPDYEHLLEIVEEIDILEVFNPRVALTAFNEEAERFAAKYRIVPGAGSDAHVAQALGTVMTRVHEFEGPDEFLEAMRSADIVRKHRNLVYVQGLKLLQTGGGRGGRRVGGGSAAAGGDSKPGRRAGRGAGRDGRRAGRRGASKG